jgi:hypothetical protein
MKRSFVIILATIAAGALFAGLVHAVLVAAHVSEPAATTVYGLTFRRLWATTAAVLTLIAVGIGGLALTRPGSRVGTASGPLGAILALVVGVIGGINGGLNVAMASGGPGTGNGVVGGAAAFVMGLVAVAIGGLALARSRRTAFEPRRMT